MRKYIFISNYLNHHQIPFCEAMSSFPDIEFYFIQTQSMTDERIELGWSLDKTSYPFLIEAVGESAKDIVQKHCADADVIIIGDTKIDMGTIDFNENALIWLYRERLFKKSIFQRYNPITRMKLKSKYSIYKNKKTGLLCAGAYVASDFKGIIDFPAGVWKWGYFPQSIKYNVDEILGAKQNNEVLEITWVGRFIDWKRTSDAILLAEMLKDNNIKFNMNIVGSGALKTKIENIILKKGLTDSVILHESKTPDQVRELMLKSNIFLSTSNRKEGWGAVLNEAMNSMCAVVACKQIGSVPYLIEDSFNGFSYSCANIKQLYNIIKKLNTERATMAKVSMNAYYTISQQWNADIAAKRLKVLSEISLDSPVDADLYNDDICSNAKKKRG